MKNLLTQSLLAMMCFAVISFSCNKDQSLKDPVNASGNEHEPESDAQTQRRSPAESQDWSGTVHTIIVTNQSYGQGNSVDVSVPSEYILVGGGAAILPTFGAPGAYLTAAYPDGNLSTWHASSKDHQLVFPHTLVAYAIGLRLDGVPKAELKKYIKVDSATGAQGTLNYDPEINVYSTRDYLTIGGGGRINGTGDGTLLNLSIPNTPGWYVTGHHSVTKNPSTASAFAINIKPDIPGFGTLETQEDYTWTDYAPNPDPNGYKTSTVGVRSGWVLTGCGGDASYNAGPNGRFLTAIIPDPQLDAFNQRWVKVISKDHPQRLQRTGEVSALTILLRKKR
ncbi:hypothetical protein [Chitinophaga nivalis]|uniref:Uncharacterized protein n=1 Tax=Chitinophaga nivalis TaxID=2991709 RepID=A0ABT3IMJ2_9BACT|nr:hypothetical protein [Chitinophaga nivalis]MCW3465133.1 hypothetical protein [Chitinophaga nivalis]MCW3485175.1 hypothetical protein [Chitinophaga nivalis]